MKRFNIEEVPLVSLFIATDAQKRIRLSADIINLYRLSAGQRVRLGYDPIERAIGVKLSDNHSDPTAAYVDKRGYLSAGKFYTKTQLPLQSKRYVFAAEQDGWLIFTAGTDTKGNE